MPPRTSPGPVSAQVARAILQRKEFYSREIGKKEREFGSPAGIFQRGRRSIPALDLEGLAMRALRRDEGYRVPFDAVTIFLHWATVILIVFQAGTGLSLEFAERSIPTKLFLDIHRSTGMAIWLIAFSRLL